MFPGGDSVNGGGRGTRKLSGDKALGRFQPSVAADAPIGAAETGVLETAKCFVTA